MKEVIEKLEEAKNIALGEDKEEIQVLIASLVKKEADRGTLPPPFTPNNK